MGIIFGYAMEKLWIDIYRFIGQFANLGNVRRNCTKEKVAIEVLATVSDMYYVVWQAFAQ